jgi:UDP:flavonoid glycosyltransferase YjiC (YdhE family)
MELDTSPILSPPATEFPYPEPKKARKEAGASSESTLYESRDGENPILQQKAESNETARPSLAAAKYQTDVSRPMAQRHPLPMIQRKSTSGHQLMQPRATPETGHWSDASSFTSSSSSSSSSEDERTFSGAAELNQVRRRPRKLSRTDTHGRFSGGNDQFQARGKVSQADGRLHISVNETANSGYLAKALGATLHRHLHPQHAHVVEAHDIQSRKGEKHGSKARIPTLNIVIMVIGSRGDIQPFLKIGKILKEKYGHRVRIATHPTFKTFVEQDIGLEFFSVGGDPSELMAFMVKNPGLIPKIETVKAGEIGKRRDSMYEMFQGFWRACINATDDEKDVANLEMMGTKYPFVADAIIANPPSFAHFHCAEKLGIPLHLVFTFPYTPTQSFPHPLANIKASNVDQNYTNFMSYPLVELMTWQGLGDLVNKFRTKTLALEPLSTLWAPGQLSRLKVPFTYLWSPSLVPKPEDWGPEIDIAGYVFLDLASSFKPPESLTNFLDNQSEKALVYIGFGSIAGIEDPAAFTRMIFDAVEKAGVRAVVSKGWGGMGDGMDIPDSIYMIDNVPHDWLFPRVDAVIHHGGAGTTAIGLKCGKPTMIVPFFGDQPFWSAMIVRAGAGAKRSLGLKKLTTEKFAEGIRECLLPEAKERAAELAKRIAGEGDGAENMVDSFHAHLPLEGQHSMRCSVFEDRVAVWTVKRTKTNLSALAADILVESKHLKWHDLVLKKHYQWHDFQGPGEPVTGAGGAFISSLYEVILGMSSIPTRTRREMKIRERQRRKRKRKTVGDAMALPGQIVQAREVARGTQEPQANLEKVNLLGEAEPLKATCKNVPFTKKAPGDSEPTEANSRLSRANTQNLPRAPSKRALVAKSTAVGLGHSAKALASMPIDIMNALALGFRNAPRLYGDPTVRPPPHHITGVRSGLRAAGSELGLGLYDGVAGLVRLPYGEMKQDGLVGLATGFGKGVGGLFLKPISGMIGVGAYSSKGVQAELRKHFRDTLKTERWIRRARMNQGAKDIRDHMNTSSMGGRHGPQGNTVEELRTQALTQWTSRERRHVEEAREKEQKSILPKPKRRYLRNKHKVAGAVEA